MTTEKENPCGDSAGPAERLLCYVSMSDGLKLPVLDITHPLFSAGMDEKTLEEVRRRSPFLARQMKEMSEAQKNDIQKRSLIFGERYHRGLSIRTLSGISTYMLKLGPHLIGGGEKRKLDRMLATGISSIAARMRIRDLCRLQAEALIPLLAASPRKKLVLINIAGGAAADSFNTLILIQRSHAALLQDRPIEIELFEIDAMSRAFADACIAALQAPGCCFHGLNIFFRPITYDWEDPRILDDFLSSAKGGIMLAASEGGLFEYGGDDVIHQHLRLLYEKTPDDTRVAGSVLRDLETIDPTIPAMAETSGGPLRFLGKKGLDLTLEQTGWKLDGCFENNPVYIVFTLKK